LEECGNIRLPRNNSISELRRRPRLDNGADITAFTFTGISGTAIIDKDALTVTATADETVDLASITAAFTLSSGATATVNDVAQVSGTTANDFTGMVNYIVTSSDGRLINIWKVIITGGKASKFFGVEKGKVVYNYTSFDPDNLYTIEQTRTLIFDNYGERIRMETEWWDEIYEEMVWQVMILDEITDKAYVYGNGDYPNYEEYPIAQFSRYDTEYHCWAANSIQWGSERENLQIHANQNIAGNSCSIFSFTEDGDDYQYAEWNNITFWKKNNELGDVNELKATSFSTSIPGNSFIPYGGE
jgi:hypothetical protein